MNVNSFDIAILAAGEGNRLKRNSDDPPKAWVELSGKHIFRYVFSEAEKLNPHTIYVVAHCRRSANIPLRDNIQILNRSGSYIGDLFGPIDAANNSKRPMLIVHADAVLITAEIMIEMLEYASESDAGFIWPGVPVEDCFPEAGGRRYVPGTKYLARTNALVVKPWMLNYDKNLIESMANHDLIGEIVAGIRVLGAKNAFKALVGRLSVSTLCNCMAKALGCKVDVPEMMFPELAFDVDHPGDLRFAEQILTEREFSSK